MASGHVSPSVFNIPAGVPFLPALADAIKTGALTGTPLTSEDPFALGRLTLFLPTRRAARVMRDELLNRIPNKATVMPRIRPLAEIDEELLDLQSVGDGFNAGDHSDLPPAIKPFERRLALTRLALAWSSATRRDAAPRTPGAIRPIPANPADAAQLAVDLERVMDAITNEGVGYDGLKSLVPEEFAKLWQLSLDFLSIVSEHWPKYLAEQGAMDAVDRRNRLIMAEAKRLESLTSSDPVIAAGSTGSLPATASLLRTIARLPQGAVVLPGLDRSLDDSGWQAIGTQSAPRDPGKPWRKSQSNPGHPQFGLKLLLQTIGIDREAVTDLADPARHNPGRTELLSQALRPAETTQAWMEFAIRSPSDQLQGALSGIATLAADNEAEEALAIALAIREHIETKPGSVALVTPDRNLARRVRTELRRWRILVDDSAGSSIDQTAPGIQALLAASVTLLPFDAITLLALLKHPLTRLGRSPGAIRRTARRIELALLRGPRLSIPLTDLPRALSERRTAISSETPASRTHRSSVEADWEEMAGLVTDLVEALRPLTNIPSEEEALVGALADALGNVVSRLGDSGHHRSAEPASIAGPEHRALTTFLGDLTDAQKSGLTVNGGEFPDLLATLMKSATVDPAVPTDGRVHIWGALEARLQTVDLMILGGLSEGIWPSDTRLDPWLSRPMRDGLGLPAPERRIGLSAHDFATLAASSKVLLTRSLRADGSPTNASRWLMRLEALIGSNASKQLAAKSDHLLQWARTIDARPIPALAPAARPVPKPPVSARPKTLSITEIETWIRDPYAVYARHVLDLHPVEVIAGEPDLADRGSLIHRILEAYTERRTSKPGQPPAEMLLEIGREFFARWQDYPDIAISWWPRFERAAAWFADWETQWLTDVDATHGEVAGKLALTSGDGALILNGRADRIDRLSDGTLAILDYKTGQAPSKKQILAALAPQLPLEAAMARDGHFKGVAEAPIGRTGYVQISGQHPPGTLRLLADDIDLDALADTVLDQLKAMIAAYAHRSQGYLSRARPLRESVMDGPYDHLARTRAWSIGGEDDP